MLESKKCNSCGRVFHTETDFLTNTFRWRKCAADNLWFNCACGSTLIIPKGKYDWYSPELALGEEARSVFNKLSTLKDLPHIPAQVLEVQRLVNDSNSNPKEIANALKQDPIGAAQLLVIAENIQSSRNPGSTSVHSLEHAIVYLGAKSVGELVLTSALRQFKFPESSFSFERFWHEAYLCGSIAEYLNSAFRLNLNQDEVYLAGSMCNLGKLVMAYSFPALASKVEKDVNSVSDPVSWIVSEKSYNFPDHRVLGEISASFWGFPTYIAEASRRHHDLLSNKKSMELYELVAVANQLVHWVLLMPSRMDSEILDSFYRKSGRREAEVEALIRPLGKINESILARTTEH